MATDFRIYQNVGGVLNTLFIVQGISKSQTLNHAEILKNNWMGILENKIKELINTDSNNQVYLTINEL